MIKAKLELLQIWFFIFSNWHLSGGSGLGVGGLGNAFCKVLGVLSEEHLVFRGALLGEKGWVLLSEPSRLLLSTVVEVLAKLSDDLVSAVDEGKEIDYQRAGPLLQLVVLQFVIGIVFVESFVEIALQLFDCFPQHFPSRVGLLTLLDQFFQFGHFDPHFFVDKINGR